MVFMMRAVMRNQYLFLSGLTYRISPHLLIRTMQQKPHSISNVVVDIYGLYGVYTRAQTCQDVVNIIVGGNLMTCATLSFNTVLHTALIGYASCSVRHIGKYWPQL